MADEFLVEKALTMLKADDIYLDDARKGVRVNKTIVGRLLTIEQHTPRQYAEDAVREALRRSG
jgi:hypothetical protein